MPHPLPAKAHCPAQRAFRVCAYLAAALLLLVFSAAVVPASGKRQTLPHPGFRSIGIWEPQSSLRMDIAAWYPSPRAARDVLLDGWLLRVSKDYQAVPGKYPVILISHDSADGRLASHDLAAHLARHGFIVIAPAHPGDNYRDTSALFSAENFAARPRHIITAFKSAAEHPVIGPMIDRNRIGLLGVGSGAATVLQLAGAEPDLSRLAAYCPEDAAYTPLCSNWAKSFHADMERAYTALREEHGKEYFTPALSGATEKQTAVFTPEADAEKPAPSEPQNAAGTAAVPEEAATPPQHQEPQQSPILAIGLLSPGLISLFPDESLQNITVPVGIMAAENDSLYPPSRNGSRLQEMLPQRPASRVLQDANHYDLRPPCPPVYQETFPALCGDPGPSAVENRKIRNDFFVRFFQKLLGPPDLAESTGK